MERSIKKYRAELNAVLLTRDLQQFKAFARNHDLPFSISDEILEVTFHKAITGSTTLPREFRRQSKLWLESRQYHSLDDGDL